MRSEDDERVGPDEERQLNTPPSIIIDIILETHKDSTLTVNTPNTHTHTSCCLHSDLCKLHGDEACIVGAKERVEQKLFQTNNQI